MGSRFEQLPEAVQRFHRLVGDHSLQGWVETSAPASLSGRLLAWGLGSPQRAEEGPIRFELKAQPELERWTRHFPAKTMSSTLSLGERRGQAVVVERLGLARLEFELLAPAGRLEMRLLRMRFFGVPCPRSLMPRILAIETGEADRLNFEVEASVPWIGRVTRYRGHLLLPPQSTVWVSPKMKNGPPKGWAIFKRHPWIRLCRSIGCAPLRGKRVSASGVGFYLLNL